MAEPLVPDIPSMITCRYCGNPRFAAGEIVPNPDGGYDVVAICRECKGPNPIMWDDDPQMAKMLLQFFAAGFQKG